MSKDLKAMIFTDQMMAFCEQEFEKFKKECDISDDIIARIAGEYVFSGGTSTAESMKLLQNIFSAGIAAGVMKGADLAANEIANRVKKLAQ